MARPAARVLLVLPDHWSRALRRAELLERSYDGVGAADLKGALSVPRVARGRGPVRAIVVDQDSVGGDVRLVEARGATRRRQSSRRQGLGRACFGARSRLRMQWPWWQELAPVAQ